MTKFKLFEDPIFEKSHLSMTYGIDDKAILGDLYSSYVSMLKELMDVISHYAGGGTDAELERIAFLSHKLKSTSFSIGAISLGNLLSDLETAAKDKNEHLGYLLRTFAIVSKDTLTSIEDYLANDLN